MKVADRFARPAISRIDWIRAWRQAPVVATTEVIGVAKAVFYLTGGLEVLACALLFEQSAALMLIAIGVVIICTGVVCYVGRAYWPRAFYHAVTFAGTGLVTACVLLADDTVPALVLSSLYLFMVIDAAFYFSIRGGAVHWLTIGLCATTAYRIIGIPWGMAAVLAATSFAIWVVVLWLARVSDEAEEDHLTQLPNRRGLERRLQTACRRAAEEGTPLVLAILDLDNFKQYNDSRGHLHGDELLVGCARAWRALLPEGGHLGRYGGDEFVLLLPGYALGAAADITDRMRVATPAATVSVGVAALNVGDSMSMLLSRADVALYEAKLAGRNRTTVHGDPGRVARELELAAGAGELRIFYQPLVELATREVVGYEALLRWQHPQRGLVPPVGFIPEAERSGAIHAIGRWLVTQVTGDIAAHRERMPHVGINVSLRELQRADYADMVIAQLRRHGIGPEVFIVEVTESAFADGDEQVYRNLQKLRTHGVLVAIDDLGAGYSSLRRIQDLPIDFIKLDGSMTRMIPDDGDRAPILEALVAMGNSLDVRLVAEWIETPHQADVLQKQGYFLGQGYLFGKPAPLTELFAAQDATEEAATA